MDLKSECQKQIIVNYEGEVVKIILELKSYPVDPVILSNVRDRYGFEEKNLIIKK